MLSLAAGLCLDVFPPTISNWTSFSLQIKQTNSKEGFAAKLFTNPTANFPAGSQTIFENVRCQMKGSVLIQYGT